MTINEHANPSSSSSSSDDDDAVWGGGTGLSETRDESGRDCVGSSSVYVWVCCSSRVRAGQY